MAASAMAAFVAVLGAQPAPAWAAALQQPASATAVAGRRLIVVTWTAPTNPSSPVDHYKAATYTNGTASTTEICQVTTPFSGLTCTISNLLGDTAYTVGVIACPHSGNDTDCSVPTSAAPVTTGPPGTPIAPTVAYQGDPNTMRVSWTAPDQGAGIASYKITPTPSTGLTGTCMALVLVALPTNCDVTGLTSDQSYTFRVTATGVTNAAGSTGTSVASPSSVAKIAGPPHTPGKPTLTRDSDTEVTVGWDRPSGGQTISGYTVHAASSDGGMLPPDCTAGAEDTDCQVTGLDPAKSYTFTVRANGESPGGGSSAASVASDAIVPGLPGVPDAPTVELGAQAGQVTVYWEAPDGGTVTTYRVTADPTDGGDARPDCLVGTGVTHCDFTGLTDGKTYRFQVTAINAAGSSVSPWSASIVSQLPAKPATPGATLGNAPGKVQLNWTAPSAGGPVVYYTVTAIPASGSNTGTQAAGCGFDLTTPSCVLTGLSTTTSYTFTVAAVGDLGTVTSDPSNSILPDKPGAPTSVTLTTGMSADLATLTWGVPAGGGVVGSYAVTVTSPDGGAIPTACGPSSLTARSCSYTALDVTKSYTFTVRAQNAAGGTDTVAVATVGDKPDVPTTVAVALAGSPGTATVTWGDPNTGTATRYIVTAASSDGGTIPEACMVIAPATESCPFTGLSPTKSYTFTVRALNPLGWSDAAPTQAIVPDKPGAPTAVVVTVGASPGYATVTWSPPSGGGAVASYTVTASSSDGMAAIPSVCPVLVSATRSCNFTTLSPAKPYAFTVRAINASGYADALATSEIVPDKPGTPTGIVVTLGANPGTAIVTWNAPSGSAVVSYRVTATSSDGTATIPPACPVLVSAARSCTFTGLDTAKPYAFTVRASNAAGDTDASPTTEIVPDKPGAATSVVAALGASPGNVTVTWGVPGGGGAVVGYTVTAASSDGGTIPAACPVSPGNKICNFTGLSVAKSYTFTVRASNASGDTDASATPAIVPDKPAPATAVVVTVGAPGTITVTWSPPSGGGAVVGYTVTPASSDTGATVPSACTAIPSSRTCTFSSLTAGKSYTFTVRASNASGDTDTTATTGVTPGSPAAATGIVVTLGTPPGTVIVTWNAPAGSAVTGYTVTAASSDGGTIPSSCTVTPPAARSCTFAGLSVGSSYTFTVRSSNAAGDTDATTTPAVVPNKPGAPTAVVAALGASPGTATVTWGASSGGAVATYTVTATSSDNGTIPASCTVTPPNTRSCPFTGLDLVKHYAFTVRATNLSGYTDAVATTEIVPDRPSTPTGVTVTLGVPGTATINWDAPANGGAVANYRVTAISPDGGTIPTPCDVTPPTARSCVFNSLDPTRSYSFTVRANNASGGTDASTTAPIVPNKPNPPGTPIGKVLAEDTVGLTWFAPPPGGPVANYTVTAYALSAPDTGISWAACTNVVALTCNFGGLSQAESYAFQVTANGPGGGTTTSAKSTPVTTAGPAAPAAPTLALAGPNAVQVSWAPPSTGGPVLGYTVLSDPPLSAPAGCTETPKLSCLFDRLTSGTPYTFKVVALGTVNRTATSASTDTIIPGPPDTPGRPMVAPTSANDQVLVTWAAPRPGAGIAGFTVASNPGKLGCSGTVGPSATSCVVAGLDPATVYTFQVQAVGVPGSGNSAFSEASESIVPRAPGRPTAVEVAPGDRQIAVSWTPPAGSGLRVLGYRAVANPGGASCTVNGDMSTECVITGVQNLTPYTVTVIALGLDSTGESPASMPSVRVRPSSGMPGTPGTVRATGRDAAAVVSWTAPAVTGDGIGRYIATASGASGTQSCATGDGTELTCTIVGLTNMADYKVTVVAVGRLASGTSAPSASVTVTPSLPPGTPTVVNVSAGGQTLVVTYSSGGIGSGVSGYTATAAGGATPSTCAAAASDTSCVINGVTPGTTYTVTVVANGVVPGVTSAPSAPSSGIKAILGVAPALPGTSTATAGSVASSAGITLHQNSITTITGTGFAPFTGVTVGIYPGPIQWATVVTDSTGAFSVPVTVTGITVGASRTIVAAGLPPTSAGTAIRYRSLLVSIVAP